MPGAEAAFSSLQTWWAASGSSKAIRNTCIKKIKIKIAIFSLQPPFVPEPKAFSMIPPRDVECPAGSTRPLLPSSREMQPHREGFGMGPAVWVLSEGCLPCTGARSGCPLLWGPLRGAILAPFLPPHFLEFVSHQKKKKKKIIK